MWEHNSKKLKSDFQMLQKELSGQAKDKANIKEEILALQEKCDGMRREVKELKIMFEETREKQEANEDSISESTEDDESNANFSLQLKHSLEANVELISSLQELESTVEKQKMEINNFTKAKIKNLEGTICFLESDLEEKDHEIEKERELRTQSLNEQEAKWSHKLAEKEEQLQNYISHTSTCEINKLKSQICELEKELKKREVLVKEVLALHSDIETVYADLEHKLEDFKDKAIYLEEELCKNNNSCDSSQVLKSLHMELESEESDDPNEKIQGKLLVTNKLETCNMLKEKSKLEESVV
ncbi:hypothetical protein UlMin_026059 [Ulmus minor]